MKTARRDPLQELTRLLRAPEDGVCNIGVFLAAHAAELEEALATTASDLRASCELPDEVVAPKVLRRLERRRAVEKENKSTGDAARAQQAARSLGAAVRWTEDRATLDVSTVFGDLLADRQRKYIAFVCPSFTTVVERAVLLRSAAVRRIFDDVTVSVDASGVHVRWRGGRGGHNWKPRVVLACDQPVVLTVVLPVVTPALARRGAWLGEVLSEMGFAV